MKQRVLSALVISAIGITVVIIGGIVLDIVLLLLATVGLFEFYSAFSKKGYSPFKIFGLVYVAIFALMLFLNGNSYMEIFVNTKKFGQINLFTPIFLLSTMVLLSMLVFSFEKHNVIDAAVTIFGGFYVVMLISYIDKLRYISKDGGLYLLLFAIGGAVMTDTFALFVGKAFGKKKLIPSVSPKKTVAGSVGGFLGSVIIITVAGAILYFTGVYKELAIYHYPVLGAIAGVTAQIGDLVASAIKRFTGVKDFGKLIPGHGGILDRIDSYIFTVPVVYYYLLIFGIGGV